MRKILSFIIITALAYWLLAMGGMKLVSAGLNSYRPPLTQKQKKEKRPPSVDSARKALWQHNEGPGNVEDGSTAE